MNDVDPREFELAQQQRGQATFIHSIAEQLGEASGPSASPTAPPEAPKAPAATLLGVPVWAWAALAAAGVAVFVATRKRGA